MGYSRLLQIVLLLQNRGKLTGSELASELEVSERTVYRDVEALMMAGVPVYSERGPQGGYRLSEGYRFNLTGLSPEEVETLFLLGLSAPAAELGLSKLLVMSELKLKAALPDELVPHADKVKERFLLDPPGWFREGDPVPFLESAARAVWDGIRISMRYTAWEAEAEGSFDPLGVVLKGGTWYLVARPVPTVTGLTSATSRRRPNKAPHDAEVRVYRVSRISSLSLSDERAERPGGFDLPSYWEKATARWEQGMYTGNVTVRMSPAAMKSIAYLLGPEAERVALAGAGAPDPSGWRTTVLASETLPKGLADILQFGGEVEVLRPESFRDEVAAAVERLGSLYR